MENKKKKVILLIILAVVLISTVLVFGYLVSKSDVLTPTAEVVEKDAGRTTIYISLSIPPWLILINALLIISIDLIIVTLIDTIKHIKKIEISKLRYKIPSVFIINLIVSLFIPTNMFAVSIPIAIVIAILLFIKKKLRKENDKNKTGEITA